MGGFGKWFAIGAAAVLAVGAAPVLVGPTVAGAAVIDVTTTDDGPGVGTLRSAIAAATSIGGDEIVLQANSFYGLTCQAGGVLAHGGTPLRITGNGSTIIQLCPATTVLEQNGPGTLELVDVTIMGGGGALAGGVLAFGDVVMTGATIQQNDASAAGGAGGMLVAGDLTMSASSAFVDNQAPNGVGGVDVAGTATIADSTFTQNVGASGGGLALRTSGTIDNGTFGGNQTTAGSGGAITGATVTVSESLFANNSSSTAGGAIAAATATVSTSSFGSNAAQWQGGAIFADTLSLAGTTVSDNRVTGDPTNDLYRGGGGIAAGTALTLKSSGILDNSAVVGANVWVGTVPAGTAIATQISGPTGGGTNCFPVAGDSPSDSPLASLGHNYVTDGSCFAGGGTTTDRVDPNGNPMVAPFADNGGPTPTRLPSAASPLVDAIPASVCAAADLVEQRGVTRPQGPACDIGPVELDVVVLQPTFTG